MASIQVQRRTTGPSPRKGNDRGQPYNFAVLFLVCFLVGLVVWRPPVTFHRGQIVVEHTPPPEAEADSSGDRPSDDSYLQWVQSELASAEIWNWEKANNQVNNPDNDSPRFRVSVEPGAVAGQHRILVQYDGPTSGDTVQTLEALAAHFVAAHHQPQPSRAAQLRWDNEQAALAAASTRIRTLTESISNFVEQEVARLQAENQAAATAFERQQQELKQQAQAAAKMEKQKAQALAAKKQASQTTIVQTPNPAWSELNDQVNQLERERQVLMEKLLPQHPKVQGLDQQLADVRAQLSTTPPHHDVPTQIGSATATPVAETNQDAVDSPDDSLVDATGQGDSTTAVSDSSLTPLSPVTPFDPAEARRQALASAEYLALQAQRDQAQASYDSVAERIKGLADPDKFQPETAAVASPPQIVAALRPPLTKAHLGILLVTSAATALALCFWRGKAAQAPFFTSVNDALHTLSVPLTGSITTVGGPPISQDLPPATSGPVKYLVAVGEIALIAVMILVGVSAATDGQIGQYFLQDPLSAYPAVMDQAFQFLVVSFAQLLFTLIS